MATRIGLEPTTPSVTGWCSNQLSYRAMIAQVRAASYRGNVLYYIEKSACCQAQICRKCNFLQKGVKTPSVCSLWSQPHSPFCRYATSSPGRGKSALKGTAFGGSGKVSGQTAKCVASPEALPLGELSNPQGLTERARTLKEKQLCSYFQPLTCGAAGSSA